jgi:hypothetical protein
MPTQPAQTDERLDDDGEVVSLGLNAFASQDAAGEEAIELGDSITEAEVATNAETETTSGDAPLSGYELVADMMRRQDEVLLKLDALNDRIELKIAEISAARKSEIEAMEAENAQSPVKAA